MLIDMNPIFNKIKNNIIDRISKLGRRPSLTIISTTNDFASQKYINNKIKLGSELGIDVQLIKFDEIYNTRLICNYIIGCQTDGIIVQLPLANHLNKQEIIKSIPNKKDVDGFTSSIINDLYLNGISNLNPCTPAGIISILDYLESENKLAGKKVAIINRSSIVGKPLALMLLNKDYTVTICHSKTENLNKQIMMADIIITAAGIPGLLNWYNTYSSQVIIDVSINRNNDGKVCGDVDKDIYDSENILITPVPGGVGPMTVLHLMNNVVTAAELNE